jgi:hypothetical protein
LNNRYYEVLSASGIASLASPISFKFNASTGSSYRAPSRRLIPSLIGTPLNSTLETVTLPFFEIHSLDWITLADQISNQTMGFLEDHHRTGCPGTGLRRPSPK